MRGEIWTAAGGSDYAGKPRPVLVVQDDAFDATPSITLCLLTTTRADADAARPPIDPTPENGLNARSYVMVDKVTTVPRSKLGTRVGMLAATEMASVNRAMMVFLGLAGQTREQPGNAGPASQS